MRKSLIIIAAALVLGTAASHRLRYDTTVFSDSGGLSSTARTTRVEYPPCIKGVREDSCIQLYERGVRRAYSRWLEAHGGSSSQLAAAEVNPRVYRACRGRGDDNCRQVWRRHGRWARTRNARHQAVAVRGAPARHAVTHVRPVRPTRVAAPAVPARPAPRPPAPPHRPSGGASTPGI